MGPSAMIQNFARVCSSLARVRGVHNGVDAAAPAWRLSQRGRGNVAITGVVVEVLGDGRFIVEATSPDGSRAPGRRTDAILAFLRAHPRSTTGAIAKAIGAKGPSTASSLHSLKIVGKVRPAQSPEGARVWSAP
jgi:hypothetical protein